MISTNGNASSANPPSNGSSDQVWTLSRWIALAYLSIGIALVAVLAMAGWGVFHDLELVRATLIQSEVNRLRSHAVRTVGSIQDRLTQADTGHDIRSLRTPAFDFLRESWVRNVKTDDSRLYAAVTDLAGTVIIHSNPEQEGLNTGSGWYDHAVEIAGDDVVDTQNLALASGERSYDVRVPIFVDQQEIGTYHSGLKHRWIEQALAEKQTLTKQRWTVILIVMVLVVVAAALALFHITRRLTVFSEAVKLSRVRRFAELGQLMAGIVHEIRNPLNAMRLNLHVLSRFQPAGNPNDSALLHGDGGLPDAALIIRETNREIERVEELMRILLGYARPDQVHDEELDLGRELQATLGFLRPTLERAEISVRLQLPPKPVLVKMDRDRLRQITLNLINNAKDATGSGGRIEVSIRSQEGAVELAIADDGPGVPPADRERIFEPFYSTKELGTGLGLALVRRFLDEAGGTVTCERNEPRGARFVVRLTEVAPVGNPLNTMM